MNDSDDKQFVDTNILVYAYNPDDPIKYEKAKALIKSLWEANQGAISIQVLQEFFVTITSKVPYPYTTDEAVKIIENLGVWVIHVPTHDDILAAIRLQTRYKVSFWDAMIIQSAISLNCGTIWTEDLNHEQKIHQSIIRNPFL